MITPPSNLKKPTIPTILSDYKRDDKGNIFTKDGSLLKVDKHKNLLRDDTKNMFLIDGTLVEVNKE